MAKLNHSDKWRKRTVAGACFALATTFSLGCFAACAENNETKPDDNDNTSVSATDTQTIKNGNFEFYNEMDEEVKDRLDLINSPTSWSFSSGSPSSTVKSGIIDTESKAWADMTRTGGYAFPTYTYTGANSTYKDKEVTTFPSIADAIAHWKDDNVSAYDRLHFYEIYEDDIDKLASGSTEKLFFDDYNYTVDYEDVKFIDEVGANGFRLHDGVKEGDSGVLMIHNLVTSNSVVGTAQYYTSSSTITLPAGTAAEVSVWVKTDKLYHYAATQTDSNKDDYTQSGLPVEQRAGAYIGVTNTVGGTTLDQMQIKNINTKGEWEQYTMYVRASTFASTTFKLVLGLGQGSSSDRYYHTNGYAFFDDVNCTVISAEEYETAVGTPESPKDGVRVCTVNSDKEDKLFDMDVETADTYALDLYAGFDADQTLLGEDLKIALTSEKSGSNTYTTENKFGLGDIESNYAKLSSLSAIASDASSYQYLKNVYDNDLKDQFPFGDDEKIVMLMSSNGAAYQATLPDLTLAPEEQMLISFFVKTNKIPSGFKGASATVAEILDGIEIKQTNISAFDSTTIKTVDIDDERTDIYDGWVQCFFFVQNSADSECSFRIKLNYGPTTITGTNKTDYCDGYAAFTNFETKTLSKTEYSYASTGNQAVKVTLTGESEETKSFDTVSATAEKDIETGLALPSSFTGVLGGSSFVVSGDSVTENVKPDSVHTGLLNAKYASAYYGSDELKAIFPADVSDNADGWWEHYFGNARQPLVIAKDAGVSYGYFSSSVTVNASSYQKVSMRVKVSSGAIAYVYLSDVSGVDNVGKTIVPNVPDVTYWYDDFGNICKVDPTSKDYNSKTDIIYELQDNGLYTKKGGDQNTYFANLYNYDKDDHDNLVTADGTIAYYYNKTDSKYYAYYDENTQAYRQAVTCLPTEENGTSIVRYDYRETEMTDYGSVIKVDNTDGKLTDWVTVSFFVATGDESKTYRLEVWNGDRLGKDTGKAGYVVFDNYVSEDVSSDYTKLLNESVAALKKANGLSDKENLDKSLALYYAFTFYDSDSYLRYDINEDEDKLGNPYGSYTQSSHNEQIAYLRVNDADGTLLNVGSFYGVFLDYTATDVTVTPDDLGSGDKDQENEDDTLLTDTNIWLLISSGILAVVLLAVIVLVVVKRLVKRFSKKSKTKIKPAKDKRYRPAKASEESQDSDDLNE